MKRILVISWYFPPINSSEGLVTYKLLSNSKYEYDVFTQNSNESWSYGKSNDLKIPNNIKCIISSTNNMEEYKNEAINYFQDNIDKYDIIMTRSMPEVSHIIGLEIKKIKKDITWIASFGDPIANNPFTLMAINNNNPYSLNERYKRVMGIRKIISPKRMIKSFFYKRRMKNNYNLYVKQNNILQSKIIHNCNYVIYNSINQKDYMLKDYADKNLLDKKTIVLPHSFDEKLYKKSKIKNDKLIFSFIGHLDDIRTPHLLFAAISKLKEYDNKLSKKVEFNFYGNLSDKEKLYLLDNELLDIVKIRKSVDYIKSLEIMEAADWLIHIDANISKIINKNIFFAAKIADYIGAKTNILGITMIDGTSADILRNYNALCIENSIEEIYNYLYLIIYEEYKNKLNLEYREEFNAINVAKEFDKYIKNILGGN